VVMCLVVSYIIKLRYRVPAPLLVKRAARPDHPGVAGGDVPGGQLHHQAQVPAPLLVGCAARPDHPGVAGGDVPRGQLHHQAQVPAPLKLRYLYQRRCT
jgi:hypothetical protein